MTPAVVLSVVRLGLAFDRRTVVHRSRTRGSGPLVLATCILTTTALTLSVGTAIRTVRVIGLVGAMSLVRAVDEPYLLRMHADARRACASRVGRLVHGLGLTAGERAAERDERQ